MKPAGRPLRLAVVGAFPFPSPQGSQVFAADQARALRRVGASVELVTYGRGAGPPPPDLPWSGAPRWLSPRSLRSGPTPAKALADAALAAALLARWRRVRFDAVLAHHVEAAALASLLRRAAGVPWVYVAHTLLAEELSAYLRWGPPDAWQRLGARLDRAAAGGADAVVALSSAAEARLATAARGPVRRIPPGLDPGPEPSADLRARACARLGLAPGTFVLYAGNLDAYQDLELLARAAERLQASGVPTVAATHDARACQRLGALRVEQVEDAREARALCFAAGALALPRRRRGGFPVKLLNYLEAGRPVVAHRRVADGLEDGRDAVLLPDDAGPEAWARALADLLRQPERAGRLGAGGRRHLERDHAWPDLAARTLELVRGLVPPGPS